MEKNPKPRITTSHPTGQLSSRVDDAIGRAYEAAAAAHPGVQVGRRAFVDFVMARVEGDRQDGELAERIARLEAKDLLLACGCERGDAEACRVFFKECGLAIGAAAARYASLGLSKEDVSALVFERLFLKGASAPKISRYAGEGRLSSWVRVVAVRLLANLSRDERRKEIDDAILLERASAEKAVPGDDLSSRYRLEVKAALHEALGALSPRDRNILRYELLEGMSSYKIARLYGVHPVTVQRWLAGVHDTLRKTTRRVLSRSLALRDDELESLVSVIDSAWPLSLSRVLGTEHPATAS